MLFESLFDIGLWFFQKYWKFWVLNVILHQKLNFICHCTLRITLSEKVMKILSFRLAQNKKYCSFVLSVVTRCRLVAHLYCYLAKKYNKGKNIKAWKVSES